MAKRKTRTGDEKKAKLVHTVDRVSPATQEMIREHKELADRIAAIESFTGAPTAPTKEFVALSETDRLLLLNQLAAMSTYEYNLNVRVARAVARDAKGE